MDDRMIPLSVVREYMPKLNDEDLKELGPVEYDQSKVPEVSKKHAENVRRKAYLPDMTESFARGVEYAGLMSSAASNAARTADLLSKDTQARFKDQIEGTTNSDEVIEARRPFGTEAYKTLGDRLNSIDKIVTEIYVNVQLFGAVGDGETDDRQAIQDAYDYAKQIKGKLYFPSTPSNAYLINSTNELGHGFELDSDYTAFVGQDKTVKIIAGIYMEAIFFISEEINGLAFENITTDGNRLVEYCITGDHYAPFMTTHRAVFRRANKYAADLPTYMSVLSNSFFNNSLRGLKLRGLPNNIATSVTLNSCYANTNIEAGFDVENLCYSTFNSCGVDNVPEGVAYIVSGRGVSLNSCGAENVGKLFEFSSFLGVSINTFYAQRVGSRDANKPTEYLLEFKSGEGATISGLHISKADGYYFNYKVGLSSALYGEENITVTDNSVTREDIYFVPSFRYDRPIKLLRGDQTRKNRTHEITIDELPKTLKLYEYMEVNHTITIKLKDGQQSYNPNSTLDNYLKNISGSGKFIIEGNASYHNLVKLNGSWRRFRIENCSVNVDIKSLTLVPRDAGYELAEVVNSPKVKFYNVRFDSSSMNSGSAISATDFSKVVVQECQFVGNYVNGRNKLDSSSTITG